jgi:protein-tyrosine phosphatase
VAIDHLRGRRFVPGDFQRFDLVLAMDRDNLDDLLRLAPGPDEGARVRLLRSFDPSSGDDDLDVPDPYYGGPEGFRRVFDLVEAACKGLLAHVQSQLLPADHG